MPRPDEELIDEIMDEAMDVYNTFIELKQKLYELDELAGDKLSEWVDQHAG